MNVTVLELSLAAVVGGSSIGKFSTPFGLPGTRCYFQRGLIDEKSYSCLIMVEKMKEISKFAVLASHWYKQVKTDFIGIIIDLLRTFGNRRF